MRQHGLRRHVKEHMVEVLHLKLFKRLVQLDLGTTGCRCAIGEVVPPISEATDTCLQIEVLSCEPVIENLFQCLATTGHIEVSPITIGTSEANRECILDSSICFCLIQLEG